LGRPEPLAYLVIFRKTNPPPQPATTPEIGLSASTRKAFASRRFNSEKIREQALRWRAIALRRWQAFHVFDFCA